ncbi:MAG: cation diffusion facilitator family transporter [Dehalococcoidales bacterium]|nr:cation diffusion facilitator family transporter [Dehalococcoidales bacterium]
MFSGRKGAVRLSVIVVISLIVIKIVVAVITGSLSILAQGIDSFMDLFAVSITFLAIHLSAKPADKEHPFGHGKAENIAAIIQAVLIFFAGGAIIYSAVMRGSDPTELELTEAGIAVMAVSIVASILLFRHLRKVAREEDSMALEANARNIATDVYSASAVLIGLVVVRFTGWKIIDDILAGIVALLILKVGIDVLRSSFGGLVDVKLPEEEEKHIRAAITEHYGSDVVEFHKLRTRKSGIQRYIDLHLVMPKHLSVEQAHAMCDHLEKDMKNRLRYTDVTIHVEPCNGKCEFCQLKCDERKMPKQR